jgi:CRISPR-associated protein Cas1
LRLPVALALRIGARESVRLEHGALADAKTIEDVRLIEARAAVAYFRPWTALPLRWKGTSASPIPAAWYSLAPRSSAVGRANRNSTHPANSILNYCYALLQTQVTVTCAQAGLDSTAGIIHARRPGRPALVFDLMEPLRPAVDACVIAFLRSHVFARADFPIGNDGVVRLHPQLARAALSLRLDDQTVTAAVDEFKMALRSA